MYGLTNQARPPVEPAEVLIWSARRCTLSCDHRSQVGCSPRSAYGRFFPQLCRRLYHSPLELRGYGATRLSVSLPAPITRT
jgi:hypothetical protein